MTTKTEGITCFDVAHYFLQVANSTGSYVSNLKLQKLVYYAQAWHLAIEGKKLFEEEFEAWIHGPAIPALFSRYKHFEWKPILEEVPSSIHSKFSSATLVFLREVTDVYFCFDGYELERMTHAELPWQWARKGSLSDELSTSKINTRLMQDYYRKKNRASL